MNTTTYLINAILVLLVVRQIREHRLDLAGLALPVIAVGNATVKTHINRIFAKTGARDRAQAMRYAYQHGLAVPTDPPGDRTG